MGRVSHDAQTATFSEAVVADFEHIRTIAEAGQSVFVAQSYRVFARAGVGGQKAVEYYLAGRVLGRSWPAWPDIFAYDFLVSPHRIDIPALLTPDNRQIFLYRQSDYAAQVDEMVGKSELLIRRDGHFDVYRNGNKLIYVGRQGEDRAAQFIPHAIPAVGKPFYVALSPAAYRAGFTDRSPWQWERGSDAEGWSNVFGSAPLDPADAYTPTTADVGRQLRAFVHYTDSRGNRVKAMTVHSLPVQPGSATETSFFLHLVPADVNDLPDHRKWYGFDNLDFRFGDYRLPLAPPVAVRELPDYAIAGIRTGQFLLDENGSYTNLWEGEVRFDE